MNTLNILKWAMPAMVVLAFSSCEKEDPIIPNEEELITTVQLTLSPTGMGANVVFEFQDLDGDGGTEPVITAPSALIANQTYTGTISFLSELESPAEDITVEVNAEAEDHQVFYQVSGGLNSTLTYTDADANGNPVGLTIQLETGDASSGQLTITLRHEPDKSASGVSTGNISNAGGESDIEVTFDVSIQ